MASKTVLVEASCRAAAVAVLLRAAQDERLDLEDPVVMAALVGLAAASARWMARAVEVVGLDKAA